MQLLYVPHAFTKRHVETFHWKTGLNFPRELGYLAVNNALNRQCKVTGLRCDLGRWVREGSEA